MAGYIGTKAAVVTPGAERKKVFSITTTTTSLTGLAYTPGFVHVFHNGVRLVDGTDYTATNGTSLTLTTAAQNGDEVVVISYATFQTSDTVSASAGGTFSNAVTVNGNLTVDTNTLFVDAANNRVGVGTSSPSAPLSVYNASNPYANFADAANYLNVGVITSNYGLINSSLPISFQVSDTERARIDASGNLLAGTTTTIDGSRITSVASGTVSLGLNGSGGAGMIVRHPAANQVDFTTTAASSFFTFSTNTTERARIDASGNVLVGTTGAQPAAAPLPGNIVSVFSGSSKHGLNITTSTGGTSTLVHFGYSAYGTLGSITTNATTTSYNTSSDYRLKENVVPLAGAADRLMQIPVCRFNFIADPDNTVDGFLAHEVQAFVPECVTGQKDEVDDEGNPKYQGIDQSKLVPLLAAALQEALTEIQDLKARVATLEGGAA